jgi:hypothetical protein
MTREEIVKILAGEDYDLNKLVAEVKAEKEKQADREREEWQQDVAMAQSYLLNELVTYVETIFGVVLTKEEVEDFQKGLNRLSAELMKMKECGKPVVEPKVWVPKKGDEDFLKAFAKML